MNKPTLWVWIGNSETDNLDILRYVRATDEDILSNPVVVDKINKINEDWYEYIEERETELKDTIDKLQELLDKYHPNLEDK